jgi:asparagine synthase (glutamine-hydrolysing)
VSGIAGIYHLDRRPVDPRALKGMLDCIPHQGSDAVRIWTDSFVGLGHRQLCTTEESARELQPANSRDGTCWITFDGRIDNREELIDRFKTTAGAVANCTDVELTLHAYEIWNIECLKHLIGDFAFALWDSKRQWLFCGRDFYGIRPFYYRFDGQTFIFGSEFVQLFQDPTIGLEIDDDKIAEWLTWCGIQAHTNRDLTRTFFRGVSELPFAHGLIVKNSGIQLRRYWDMDPEDEIRYQQDQEYHEHFRHLFREAVRCRLRSNGPIGAELSGGFDSSSIVCMAQEIYRSERPANKGFAAYSMVFDDLSCDERPLIKSVVEKYSVESHFVVADDLCGLENPSGSTDSVFRIDSPEQLVLQRAGQVLYRLAHDQNVRVMLSGEGAENHVIGSQFVLDSLIRHRRWRELWRRLQIIHSQSSLRASISSLVKYGLIPLLPRPISMPFYQRWLQQGMYWPEWFTASFRDKILQELSKQNDLLRELPRFRDLGRQLQYESLNPCHSAFQMPFKVPIERRFPYLDRRLVEFCFGLPPEIKYEHLRETQKGNIRGRVLQRRGLNGILPAEIQQTQTKVNFAEVHRRRFQQLKNAYAQKFAPPAIPFAAKFGYLAPEKFWEVLSDSLARVENSQEVSPLIYLWINRIMQLEIWLQNIVSRKVGHASLRI